MRALILAIVAVCGTAAHVFAEEELRPLAQSGNWVAMAHYESLTAGADMCLALAPYPQGSVALRAAEDGVELRVIDHRWTLPDDVKGTIKLTVGPFAKEYDIATNTDQMVSALIPETDLLTAFSAMDKASSMVVVVGKAKPVSVSLAGSTKATNAFRTCAHIKGGPAQSGSEANPF